MPRKTKTTGPAERSAAPRDKAEPGPEATRGEQIESARETSESNVWEQLLAVLDAAAAVIIRRHEKVRHQGAEGFRGIHIDSEIEELNESRQEIRHLIRLLDSFKKLLTRRLRELKAYRDMTDEDLEAELEGP